VKVKLKVEYADGRTVEVLANPFAQVATERAYKISLADDENVHLEYIYFMAYTALRSIGKEDISDFDVWLREVAEVERVDAEEAEEQRELDPTRTGPSPATSSS
jgi:hypothetical protein